MATIRFTPHVDGWDPADRLLLATDLMGFALHHCTDSMSVDNDARGPWTTPALRFESLDPLVWRWRDPARVHRCRTAEFHIDFHPEPIRRNGAGHGVY